MTLFGAPAATPTKPFSGNLIYAPRGKAGEYSDLSVNIYRGCSHCCKYCYVPDVLRVSTEEFNCPKRRTGDFLEKLYKEAAKHERNGWSRQQVLLCFTCDPYCHLDVELGLTREVIKILHRHNFTVCTLTKGGSRALRDIDLFGPRDAFASTLTCVNDEDSLYWEPGAALPGDRMKTLKTFHDAGIFTWASLEPVLNPEWAYQIIKETHTYVSHYKVGKLNHLPVAEKLDWRTFAHTVKDLLESVGADYYLKSDLRRYL